LAALATYARVVVKEAQPLEASKATYRDDVFGADVQLVHEELLVLEVGQLVREDPLALVAPEVHQRLGVHYAAARSAQDPLEHSRQLSQRELVK
jgi:hypothetical protein